MEETRTVLCRRHNSDQLIHPFVQGQYSLTSKLSGESLQCEVSKHIIGHRFDGATLHLGSRGCHCPPSAIGHGLQLPASPHTGPQENKPADHREVLLRVPVARLRSHCINRIDTTLLMSSMGCVLCVYGCLYRWVVCVFELRGRF